MCRKILKGVENIEKLPLNFNILYEVVTRDPLLSSVNFEKCLNAEIDENDENYETELEPYLCMEHEQRIKHFYCSEHPSIFCRECIKDLHNLEACYVVDLYEIEKMRKLQEQNNTLNTAQLKNRTDGAQQSCILPPSPTNHENPLLKNVNKRPKDTVKKALFQPAKAAPQRPDDKQKQPKAAIENEDLDMQDFALKAPKAQTKVNPKDKLIASVRPNRDDYASYGDEDSDDQLGSEGELNSDQKQKLRRDLAMMGYDEDDDFDEINEANARLMMGGFESAEAFK
jgi:hypothetical protein